MNTEAPVKLLLVDDLDENLLAMNALLRREGIEILSAKSGRAALELLLQHDVALALLDVEMPEMDGFELAELMRGAEKTKRVPIIFVTAGGRDAQRVFRGYEVGAVDFLFKPVDPILLGHKVSTFVELHRDRLEIERLAEKNREMLRLNEMFIAAIGHDLRQPLNGIVMGASILEREALDSIPKQTIARIRSSAERMVGMLDQLYDLTRARLGGGIAIDAKNTNLRVLADKVVEELKLTYPDRTLDVVYDSGSTTGTWDEKRLGQVLANLVGNALRYGDKEVPVSLRVRGAGVGVEVEIHNGGAIPENVLPTLFDPFQRGTVSKEESLGLGLYIVKQIVDAHGGTIRVASTKEKGTTFCVDLPRTVRRPSFPATHST